MGFLKRFFSFGSKKNKKRSPIPDQLVPPTQAPSIDEEQRRKLEEEEHEAAVGRLLRSSSSRYAVVKEIDYSNLPPLPHPINDVLANCNNTPKEQTPSLRPSPSTLSLASSNFSRTSTFSVTVHDRQRHAATEFPNANGELGKDLATPTQQRSKRHSGGHQLGLRSDPSVASLIEMYDDHGRLPAEAFSNSPPSPERHGRPQNKRGGSTLRELLGGSSSPRSKADSNVESDISWAERFLGEVDSVDSHTSSYGPRTPSACTHSTNDHMGLPKAHEFTFSTADISTHNFDDPAITSMEVELSVGSAASSILGPTPRDSNPYMNTDSTTPQRASQVFSFITKRNTVQHERVPSRIPFLSSSSDMSHDGPCSRFSTDGSSFDARASRQSFTTFQEKDRTPMQRTPKPKTQARRASATNEDGDDPSDPVKRKVRVLMSGPTKIMVTAPTPGTQQDTPSRIPIRGPRQPPSKRSSARRTPMLTHRSTNGSASSRGSSRSKDSSTGIPRRRPSRRSASRASDISVPSSRAEADAIAVAVCALDQLARNKTYHSSPNRGSGDKENQQLGAKMDIPSTPLRAHTTGRRTLFRKAVTPNLFQPSHSTSAEKENPPVRGTGPSGNSSSELSPVGKQMMLDARKQRMRMGGEDDSMEKERRSGRQSTTARALRSPF